MDAPDRGFPGPNEPEARHRTFPRGARLEPLAHLLGDHPWWGTSEAFWSRVTCDESGCWLWSGTRRPDGYGRLRVRGRDVYPHRVAYQMLVAPIPDDLQLDHLCRVRRCVRPSHLEPVRSRVNTLRGTSPPARNAGRTECIRGHAAWFIRSDGSRACRLCKRARERQYKALRRKQGVDTAIPIE